MKRETEKRRGKRKAGKKTQKLRQQKAGGFPEKRKSIRFPHFMQAMINRFTPDAFSGILCSAGMQRNGGT
jgi:hypothetical protein